MILAFQGFGLQIGSDFYLLLDPSYRAQLEQVASSISSTVSLSGTWVADNGTTVAIPLIGTWTFNHNVSPTQYDIIDGCYRPKRFSWYLQPFPTWTSFIIVPMFSLLSSLANLQPFRSKQLPVMVIISCCSYASNKIANHYIFNRSDIVSAIGAFTVGLLGNIAKDGRYCLHVDGYWRPISRPGKFVCLIALNSTATIQSLDSSPVFHTRAGSPQTEMALILEVQ